MKQNLGEFYDETSDFQQAQFNYLRKLITAHFPVTDITTMIDIGSGTGSRTKQCFEFFPNLSHITAIEPDPDMHNQAISQHADPRIEYLQKSAAHISAMKPARRAYDLVLSHWVMHWIKEKETLFRNLERIIDDHKKSYLAIATCEALPQILQDIDTYIRYEFDISPMGDSPFFLL